MSTRELIGSAGPHEGPRPGYVVAGRYELLEPIGYGGMGSVWRARHWLLGIKVAVKLHRGSASDPSAVLAYLHEASLAARIQHRSTVRILDVGIDDDRTPYIVMDLLEGETLGAMLGREGPLDAVSAVSLALPIASALRAAHEVGIIHGDVTPNNIMLVRDHGRVEPMLLDFGVASLLQHAFEERVVCGTPAYMSPEQAGGAALDHRSDIFTFSAVLWEMLEAYPLFGFGGSTQVMRRVAQASRCAAPRPRSADAELWLVLQRGLNADANARWQSFGMLGEALASWLARRGRHADASGASLRAHWLGPVPAPAAPLVHIAPAAPPASGWRGLLARLANATRLRRERPH